MNHHRSRSRGRLPLLQRRRGEEGSSLVIALATVIVMSVVLAALATYVNTGQRSIRAYESKRDGRYGGDAAVKEAVNWAKDQPDVGRDPELNASDPPCVYHTSTSAGDVTVSCAADPGGGSGTPEEPGLSPPESLLTLGTRKVSSNDPASTAPDEPGPYNVPDCKGWWDDIIGWFSSSTNVDPNATGPGEWGTWFRGRKGLGTLGATCDTDRTRQRSNFTIEGDLVAAGRVQVSDGGTVTVVDGGTYAGHGCVGVSPSCGALGTRSGESGPLSYLNGTSRGTDPGRTNPGSPATNPTDIAEPWRAVGFNADGTVAPLGYTPTTLMPSALPERTTAYVWDNATGGLTATAACAGSAATIVFLPGWYRDASVLNRYTAGSAATCKDVTYWFAPDPGPDGQLLTEDDRTGAYYFDFRSGAGQGCTGMPVHRARWCVGNAPDQNARIVVGTPNGWAPLGGAPINTPDTRPRIQVQVTDALTIDEDLSQSWFDADRARRIDGQAARYHADICIFVCFSMDRAIRLRDFAPQVTSPPIDEPGAPKGRIYVDVTYAVTNPNAAEHAKLEIRAVGDQSGDRSCGTYDLFTTKSDADHATGLHTYTFTAEQAKNLADLCGTVDLINGYELTLKVTGNGLNFPAATDVYLDGMAIRYDSFQGANFPNPEGPGAPDPEAAVSDCDPAKAGAQLVFGGDAHLYVADGSLEVCAGPYPTSPETHMSIGLYGVPAVDEVTPTGITGWGGNNGFSSPLNAGNVTAIDRNEVTIRYGGSCQIFCGHDYDEGWVNMAMEPYSPPAGYTIDKVEARVSYNPKNTGCSFLWDCPGRAPQLQFPSGSCGGIDFPKNPDRGPLQVANWGNAVLYGGGASSCVTPAQLASGVTLRWAARAECNIGVCGSGYTDTIDGIALQITLRPTDASQPRLIPQHGCITAHPNYNGGSGNPDCAVVRADTNSFADNWSWPWADKEGMSRGRISVQGTIYAPSAALEVDDTDVAYPLATRGVVLRHLRMSGYGFRQGYEGTAISGDVDKTPSSRETTFTACTQTPARRGAGEPCDADDGDVILTRARVVFGIDRSGTDPTASVPLIQWWSSGR